MQDKLQHYKDVMEYVNRLQNIKVDDNIQIKKIIIDEEKPKVYVKKEAKNG